MVRSFCISQFLVLRSSFSPRASANVSPRKPDRVNMRSGATTARHKAGGNATQEQSRRRLRDSDLDRSIDAAAGMLDVHVGRVRVERVEVQPGELGTRGAVGGPATQA